MINRLRPIMLIVTLSLMIIGYSTYVYSIDSFGSTDIAFNENEFDIRVSKVKLDDVDISNNISADGKSFTFDTNFNDEGDSNGLYFVVDNNSYQYDAHVSVNCTPENNDIIITKQNEILSLDAQTGKSNYYTFAYSPQVIDTIDFDYTGGEQTYVIPKSGIYQLETWGARGGISLSNGSPRNIYGKGGYAVGSTSLDKDTTLYINVGGAGGTGSLSSCAPGGYNGGGKGTNDGGGCSRASDDEASGGGGGATHIATSTGLLKDLSDNRSSVLIVAAGGGGASYNYYGGAGGGLNGLTTGGTTSNYPTQLTGYTFGQGQDGSGAGGSDGVAGGGGGWYGGFAANISGQSAGTGGSSYINGLSDAQTIAGNASMPEFATEGTMTGNAGDGHARISYKGTGASANHSYVCTLNIEGIERNSLARKNNNEHVGETFEFSYTGGEQNFVVPYDGVYKLEVWGAQGGDSDYSSSNFYDGGYGGYSTGEITLAEGKRLYINVGGKGPKDSDNAGGYNGGGRAYPNSAGGSVGSGGGATHIATSTGVLNELQTKRSSVIIVAGGGGGASFWRGGQWGYGGAGGGFEGVDGHTSHGHLKGTGGTQSIGGTGGGDGSFGLGATSYYSVGSAGGGGGFYGGGSSKDNAGGGGGSGYISSPLLTNREMFCYGCTENDTEGLKTTSTTGETIHGNDRNTEYCPDGYSEDSISKCAKKGHGFARITFVESKEYQGDVNEEIDNNLFVGEEFLFNYTGKERAFYVPHTGKYKLEVWGAQGGDADYDSSNFYAGGYGGYSTGVVSLTDSDVLYIQIGGKGPNDEGEYGGYNGGGRSYRNGGGGNIGAGGGATHIATASGLLKDFSENTNKLLIVAGGGGGSNYWSGGQWGYGGSGGGIQGVDGASSGTHLTGKGGTQDSGGTGGGDGSFGLGASSYYSVGSAGGGGGFYGGGSSKDNAGGGGGSGYIGNALLSDKHMACYNCTESDEEATKTSSVSCVFDEPTENCSKMGHGYVKITYLGKD